MGDILLKVHESYRWVVAVCDKDIFGRKLHEGKKALDISTQFFDGEEMTEEQATNQIVRCVNEDSTFNFVGEKSVALGKKLGVVTDEGIIYIEGIPFGLVLL